MYKLKSLFIEIGKLMKIHKSKACKIKHKKLRSKAKLVNKTYFQIENRNIKIITKYLMVLN